MEFFFSTETLFNISTICRLETFIGPPLCIKSSFLREPAVFLSCDAASVYYSQRSSRALVLLPQRCFFTLRVPTIVRVSVEQKVHAPHFSARLSVLSKKNVCRHQPVCACALTENRPIIRAHTRMPPFTCCTPWRSRLLCSNYKKLHFNEK